MFCKSLNAIYKGAQNYTNQHRKHSHFKIYLPQNQQWTTKMSKIPQKSKSSNKSFLFFEGTIFLQFFRGFSAIPFPRTAPRHACRSLPWLGGEVMPRQLLCLRGGGLEDMPHLWRGGGPRATSWQCSGFALITWNNPNKIGETWRNPTSPRDLLPVNL